MKEMCKNEVIDLMTNYTKESYVSAKLEECKDLSILIDNIYLLLNNAVRIMNTECSVNERYIIRILHMRMKEKLFEKGVLIF